MNTTCANPCDAWQSRVRDAFNETAIGPNGNSDFPAELRKDYLSLDVNERRQFLSVLGSEATSAQLSKIFKSFSGLPNGLEFLLQLRADILPVFPTKDTGLASVENALAARFDAVFDPNLLELSTITWEKSPASVVERVMECDRVHPTDDWNEIKGRLLPPSRLCFAFFHPKVRGPLIFVEVALVHGIPENIDAILRGKPSLTNQRQLNTAVFYALCSANPGLERMGLGGALIKYVLSKLRTEIPSIKNFVTLSPVSFRPWLEQQLTEANPKVLELLTPNEHKTLQRLAKTSKPDEAIRVLLAVKAWHENPQIRGALRRPLSKLCAAYLLSTKRNGIEVEDQTANLHLKAGARILRVNWLADVSQDALRKSLGFMINYSYEPNELKANQTAYKSGRVVCSRFVDRLREA